MSFWTDGRLEPKRQNRWIVHFDGIYNGNMFFATKVNRPSIEISNKEHKFLNHTFNYPGRATWKPVTLTMVDTAGAGATPGADAGVNTMSNLMQILKKSGYMIPNNETQDNLRTIAKSKAINSLSAPTGATGAAANVFAAPTASGIANGVTIIMLDSEGKQVEKWLLKNAFITKFTPSELSYEDDAIATVDIELTYDYCEFDDRLFSPGT